MVCDYRDIELPDEKFFIVGACYEFVLFDESYCVDCSKMLIVLHLFFACVYILSLIHI